MNLTKWILSRECGLPAQYGDKDFIMQRIYKSMTVFADNDNCIPDCGSVFNLEFNPDGNVLVAACERQAVLLYDAVSRKEIRKITNAHADNVNCVTFLDDRQFATCSDDNTIALWDLRYLKNKMRSLHGHSNWVKNVEYSKKDNLLVTSGFDGSIYTWDITSETEQGLIYQKVFHTSGLMRCRISPDGEKLVICTTGGYFMVIHNLDLTTLHRDLCGFRPGIFRLMQMGQQYIPQAAKFNHVFSKKQQKNRVELVTDFPPDNDAEVILTLQMHPSGHCFLSRNVSYDEQTEWSCIHDINEETEDPIIKMNQDCSKRKRKLPYNEEDNADTDDDNLLMEDDESSADSTDELLQTINRIARRVRPRLAPPVDEDEDDEDETTNGDGAGDGDSSRSGQPTNADNQTGEQQQQQAEQPVLHSRPESFVPDIWAAEVTIGERATRQSRSRASSGYNFVYAISSGVLPEAAQNPQNRLHRINERERERRHRRQRSSVERNERRSNNNNTNNGTDEADTNNGSGNNSTTPRRRLRPRFTSLLPLPSPPPRPKNKRVFQNPKKLLYYIKESNNGKGFIKEPSFSADGRLIASPYDQGVRLLALNPQYSEYPAYMSHTTKENSQRDAKELVVVKFLESSTSADEKPPSSQTDLIYCSKFSSREPLLATGSRKGKITWHYPHL